MRPVSAHDANALQASLSVAHRGACAQPRQGSRLPSTQYRPASPTRTTVIPCLLIGDQGGGGATPEAEQRVDVTRGQPLRGELPGLACERTEVGRSVGESAAFELGVVGGRNLASGAVRLSET
jgi:hypothetical protein